MHGLSGEYIVCMCRYACVYLGMHGLSGEYIVCMCRYACVYIGMHGLSGEYVGMHVYIKVCMAFQDVCMACRGS